MIKKTIAVILFIWSALSIIGLINDHSEITGINSWSFFYILGILLPAIIGFFLFNPFKALILKNSNKKIIDKAINLYDNEMKNEALILFNSINRNLNIDQNVIADYFKGLIYFNRSDYSNALLNFDYVIRNNSILSERTISQIYYYLGGIYFYQKNLEKAKVYKNKAILINNIYSNFDIPEFIGYRDF